MRILYPARPTRLVPSWTGCLLALLLLASCSVTRRADRYYKTKLSAEISRSPVFRKAFTGFHLADAATGRPLCSVNADHYFTPASNTKILTLATALRVLGDSLPRFRYAYSDAEGTIWLSGTGDPTTLHPDFEQWQTLPPVFDQHPKARRLFLAPGPDQRLERFGAGWMWDDFPSAYSAEISEVPVYGNLVRVCWDSSGWRTFPGAFQSFLKPSAATRTVRRDAFSDSLFVALSPGFPQDTCFERAMFHPDAKAAGLLLDTFPLTMALPANAPEMTVQPLRQRWYAAPVDTVYRRLMHQSDNFIAEQLLVVCSGMKWDTLDQKRMIRWTLDTLFAGLPDPPRWVDGSGLSRYNQISPRFLTALLRQLYVEQGQERMFDLLPAGGVSGTIQHWYAGPAGKPYVFAKTGTVSGVHCLSGYLVAKSGRVLVFSFMHNNFTGGSAPWKQEMQRLLQDIRERG